MRVSFFLLLVLSVTLLFSKPGLAEDQSMGFYAGPLSATHEKKVVPAEPEPVKKPPAKQAKAGPLKKPAETKERSGLLNWLREMLSISKD